MKDEIKQILDYLGNDKNYNCDNNDGSYYLELPYREAHELKDHITKLQEENKQYKEYIKELQDSLRNYHIKNNKLIYENARLKELDENYPIEEQLEDALKWKNIYKSRNEKAINEVIRVLQIILEQPSENKLDDLWIINKLEGIQTLLQGEDKNVKD